MIKIAGATLNFRLSAFKPRRVVSITGFLVLGEKHCQRLRNNSKEKTSIDVKRIMVRHYQSCAANQASYQ
jgi:hypothetical protein